MYTAIGTRELIAVDTGGIRLRGTYHRAEDQGPESGRAWGNVGVLFLNSGAAPRAWSGDVAVYWADSFANCGYPSFRFDLPGLGDSGGNLPREWLDFANLVNAGHFTAVVSEIAKSLTKRFQLSGVVLMGHCAGAVVALFAAAAIEECKGVILLDPYFFLPRPRTQLRNELSVWSTSNPLGQLTGVVYDWIRQARLLVGGKRLPSNANLPLLGAWKRLVFRGSPILVLKAPGYRASGIKPRLGDCDYLEYLERVSGSTADITVQFIDGTNHSFADAMGKTAVRWHCEHWLSARYPLAEDETTKPRPAKHLRRQNMFFSNNRRYGAAAIKRANGVDQGTCLFDPRS